MRGLKYLCVLLTNGPSLLTRSEKPVLQSEQSPLNLILLVAKLSKSFYITKYILEILDIFFLTVSGFNNLF